MSQALQIALISAISAIALVLWGCLAWGFLLKLREQKKTTNANPLYGKDHAATVREMVRHENELMNHRLNWLFAVEGLLMAGIGLAWEKGDGSELVFLFSLIGIVAAGSAMVVLDAADTAIVTLNTWWKKNCTPDGPDVLGLTRDSMLLAMLTPWRALPPAFVLAWLAMMLFKSGIL